MSSQAKVSTLQAPEAKGFQEHIEHFGMVFGKRVLGRPREGGGPFALNDDMLYRMAWVGELVDT